MDPVSIADWSNYLAAQAEVGATLTGLVFVAVSINLSRVLAIPGLTGRAAESLMQLLGIVGIATVALIPRQPIPFLGAEIVILSALFWIIQTVLQIRYLRQRTGHPPFWIVIRMLQTQCANLPFAVSGILLLRGSPSGFYWLAPGFAFSLAAGVASAWVLLVEILR